MRKFLKRKFNRYLAVFTISFKQEFAYRLNFIMWRVRNVLQIFVTFFLWNAIFYTQDRVVFGYDRGKILTYVFGLIFIRAIVLSSRSIDVAGDISRGDLNNYLVKPINYFLYWLTRDISSKFLNVIFAVGEAFLLFIILRPPFFLQTNIIQLVTFLCALIFAILIYFILLFMVNSIPFWAPELGWGGHFLVSVVIVEFLSGAMFPIDVLPLVFQKILYLTPFPYLIFFPIEIYLGKIQGLMLVKGLTISLFWIIALWFLMKKIWDKGLKAYQAYGR